MLKRLLAATFLFITSLTLSKTIYITPGQCIKLFDINDPTCNSDDQEQPRYQLKQALEKLGFTVQQADNLKNLEDVHCIITQDIPFAQLEDLKQYPKERCISLLWEPPTVVTNLGDASRNYDKQFHHYYWKILTWNDQLVDNDTYLKLHYPVLNPMIKDSLDFNQKKLCTMIVCNKDSKHPDELYSARRDTIVFFETEHPKEFDLFGRGWPNSLRTYKGGVIRKVEALKHYKFNYCYENIKKVPGYITEKIFDSFRAGCVPIYWGAPNITDYIPGNCFIDRTQFASNEALYQYLKNMKKEEYETYLSNIRNFLNSTEAQRFSINHFITTVIDAINSLPQNVPIKKNTQPHIICTASDDYYYPCLINLIGSLHQHNYDDINQIAVFDLGLTTAQKNELALIDKLQIYSVEQTHPDILKRFNTRTWGKPVPGWYAWKPVALKQAFEIFPVNSIILWVDAGTTILKPLNVLFDYIAHEGSFFHNGCALKLFKQTTDFVITQLGLKKPTRSWILNQWGLESGLMGVTKKVYADIIMPAYTLCTDLAYFADDGSCPDGFGCARPDQTIFSIFALLNDFPIYHHFAEPKKIMHLNIEGQMHPFHIACNSEDRIPETNVYCARFDVNPNELLPFIRLKK